MRRFLTPIVTTAILLALRCGTVQAADGAGAKKAAENAVPAARYGLPIDVARLATFLCGDDAGFLVGQTIVLDGGTVALMSLSSDFRTASPARFGEEYILGPNAH